MASPAREAHAWPLRRCPCFGDRKARFAGCRVEIACQILAIPGSGNYTEPCLRDFHARRGAAVARSARPAPAIGGRPTAIRLVPSRTHASPTRQTTWNSLPLVTVKGGGLLSSGRSRGLEL